MQVLWCANTIVRLLYNIMLVLVLVSLSLSLLLHRAFNMFQAQRYIFEFVIRNAYPIIL